MFRVNYCTRKFLPLILFDKIPSYIVLFLKKEPSYLTYCSRCVFYTVIFEASFGPMFTKNPFNFSAIVFSWIISFSFNYLTVPDKTISDKSDEIFRRWRNFFPTKYLAQRKIMSKIKNWISNKFYFLDNRFSFFSFYVLY